MVHLHYFSVFPKGLGLSNNFGDALNPWVFEKMIPDVLKSAQDDILLIGIGTLLGNKVPSSEVSLVFGSGGDLDVKPNVDQSWKFYCVRGPLTAQKLNLDASLVVSDSAYLVSSLIPEKLKRLPKRYRYSFMPHYDATTLMPEAIQRFSKLTGFHIINPLAPVDEIIADILSSDAVVCQAMHGAIVADALRVPWVAATVNPSQDVMGLSRYKWRDWCSSVDILFQPLTLPSYYAACYNYHQFVQECQAFMWQLQSETIPLLSSDARHQWVVNELENRLDLLASDYRSGRLNNPVMLEDTVMQLKQRSFQPMPVNESIVQTHLMQVEAECHITRSRAEVSEMKKQKQDYLSRRIKRKKTMAGQVASAALKQAIDFNALVQNYQADTSAVIQPHLASD